ncbi:lantibiotic dehydratase C-terminal domain-containing protein [Streptomyces sp. NBC_00091]|uniref:lantibiotic dehydratase C-terminal domain-containing protein n=1 Tax=Streptomyces sp. NBC_00091 TaxID=2975648 RepID=UPI0022570B56|nr:lantibiotic dehydratase C-terminal domain-containing protein [Streptomyces sp. NBC_00091]MCX5380474.1 nitroreductase family protein [Streptomyces sp. NBC_00091]
MTTAPPGSWPVLHCFLRTGPEAVDAFLVEDLAPLLDGLVAEGRAAGWAFVRHEEGGPHLRVRVLGALRPGASAELASVVRRSAEARAVETGAGAGAAEVREVARVPDDAGPGAPLGPGAREEVAALSARVAVDCVAGTGRGSRRLAVAADLAHATAWALGLDRFEAARWLRGCAVRRLGSPAAPLLPARLVHAQVNAVYAAQRESLAGRAAALREALAEGTVAGPVARWAAGVRAAAGAPGRSEVWGSELHLLFNRLGVAPDEERAVYRLAAHALLDNGEPPAYFPQGHLAPDWRYLERSKVRVGWDAEGSLRPAPEEAVPDGPEVALPGGPVPEVSLWAAVTGRTSVRKGLTGPLSAELLGTLLWGAHATSHTTGSGAPFPHRPYPSPGGLYAAGLRLFAFGVEGLAPGTYQCVPGRRALRRVGDPPALEELKAVSAYMTAPASDPLAVVVDEVPVVLGLYVDLGRLRQRYGLRALRLGLLEAGHLAQSLLLTASALGLSAMPLGGFQDDLAHELFGLDDLDRPLQYLLPLGRAGTV